MESPANGVIVVAPPSPRPSVLKSSDTNDSNEIKREKSLAGLLRSQRKLAYYVLRDFWSVSVSNKYRPSITADTLFIDRINRLKDIRPSEVRMFNPGLDFLALT